MMPHPWCAWPLTAPLMVPFEQVGGLRLADFPDVSTDGIVASAEKIMGVLQ
jgi:hypothetical protein